MTAAIEQTRPLSRNRFARLACAAALAALLALAHEGAAPPAAQAQVACPPQPAGLGNLGAAASRFTMMIRINQQANVNTYVNRNEATGGLGGRVHPQDIFVINTRFAGSTPALWSQLATNLRAAFPCNRIIALNGLTFDPLTAGYAFALSDHPAVFAVMNDFEPMDWNQGKATDPGRPAWSQRYKTALERIKAFMGRVSGTLASNPLSAPKRAGLVPIDDADWDFGEIAQAIDKKNRRLGGRHLGPLSVQTQDSCANRGASGFAARAVKLRDQYRFRFIRKTVKRKGKKRKITIRRKIKKKAKPNRANLAMQISFSDTPNPSSGMALTKTSPQTASACTASALAQGAGAFFYFASDESMRQLYLQPEIAAMRPYQPPPAP